MGVYELVPHPDTSAKHVRYVDAVITRSKRSLDITYVIEGPTRSLALPPPAKPYRADGLWQTTCFELFMATGPESYAEFNFSPSSQWAAYRFSSYRQGMESVPVDDPPIIHFSDEGYCLIVSVQIVLPGEASGSASFCVVVEEIDGTKSYWALAHAPGPPDFHNRDCWIARLPAPDPS